MQSDSLQSWLVREVREVLDRSGAMPPLLLWCDPQREWLDLLRAASEHEGFEPQDAGHQRIPQRARRRKHASTGAGCSALMSSSKLP